MKTTTTIQAEYIARMLPVSQSNRNYGKILAHAWRVMMVSLEALGLTPREAEEAGYAAQDMLTLERLAA